MPAQAGSGQVRRAARAAADDAELTRDGLARRRFASQAEAGMALFRLVQPGSTALGPGPLLPIAYEMKMPSET